MHAGSGQTQKNRCLVNVLRHAPTHVQEFCQPLTKLDPSSSSKSCTTCSSGVQCWICCTDSVPLRWGMFTAEADEGKWVYMVKLHLQDATGELDAGLFEKDADAFFKVQQQVVQLS